MEGMKGYGSFLIHKLLSWKSFILTWKSTGKRRMKNCGSTDFLRHPVLLTQFTCKVISNGFLFCVLLKSYLIKMLTLKLLEIEIAFVFHFLGNPNGCMLDYFFSALNIRHNFSYKLIPISTSYLKYF